MTEDMARAILRLVGLLVIVAGAVQMTQLLATLALVTKSTPAEMTALAVLSQLAVPLGGLGIYLGSGKLARAVVA